MERIITEEEVRATAEAEPENSVEQLRQIALLLIEIRELLRLEI